MDFAVVKVLYSASLSFLILIFQLLLSEIVITLNPVSAKTRNVVLYSSNMNK